MFIINWFKSFFSGFFEKKAKIIFLGMENAGKSSLLMRLKYDVFKQVDPTKHPQFEDSIKLGNMNFGAYDLGGHDTVLKLWKRYYDYCDAIVFMVDTTDQEKLPDSRKELQNIISDTEYKKVPILIFGNKIDKKGAMAESDLAEYLEIKDFKDNNKNNDSRVELFMCSVAKKAGIVDGFKWLQKKL